MTGNLFAQNTTTPNTNTQVTENSSDPNNNPEVIIKKYMVQNFTDMRDLYSAIMNFGNGEQELNQLMDDYSTAFAMKMQNRPVESADLFKKNHDNIVRVANSLIEVYKRDTDSLQTETVKLHIQSKMNEARASKSLDNGIDLYGSGDIYVSSAADSLQTANKLAGEGHPVQALFHYRRAKSFCFLSFELYGKPLPEKYDKDKADNKNSIYQTKVK